MNSSNISRLRAAIERLRVNVYFIIKILKENLMVQPLLGVLILDANGQINLTIHYLNNLFNDRRIDKYWIIVRCYQYERFVIEQTFSSKERRKIKWISIDIGGDSLYKKYILLASTKNVFFLSSHDMFGNFFNHNVVVQENVIYPILPPLVLPNCVAQSKNVNLRGWMITYDLFKKWLPSLYRPKDFYLYNIIENYHKTFRGYGKISSVDCFINVKTRKKCQFPVLTRKSKILALIPHYKCERWLYQCLESLTLQSRPLDAIVVIDDHSEVPPVEIVKQFPAVTLLSSVENVGPFCNEHAVIEKTNFEGYLFQDADDFSTYDRLERLLTEAEETGAELIGSQEFRIICEEENLIPVCYPQNVNEALSKYLGYPLLFPSSLISRSLFTKINGFATGLRFSGDLEFIHRAVYEGRLRNIPRLCYFRRIRSNSLTTDMSTGLNSIAREEVHKLIYDKAKENFERNKSGKSVDLIPLRERATVEFKHIIGPKLF